MRYEVIRNNNGHFRILDSETMTYDTEPFFKSEKVAEAECARRNRKAVSEPPVNFGKIPGLDEYEKLSVRVDGFSNTISRFNDRVSKLESIPGAMNSRKIKNKFNNHDRELTNIQTKIDKLEAEIEKLKARKPEPTKPGKFVVYEAGE